MLELGSTLRPSWQLDAHVELASCTLVRSILELHSMLELLRSKVLELVCNMLVLEHSMVLELVQVHSKVLGLEHSM